MENEKLGVDIEITPYETDNKRIIDGKVVSVTYHNTDWTACFKRRPLDYMRRGTSK